MRTHLIVSLLLMMCGVAGAQPATAPSEPQETGMRRGPMAGGARGGRGPMTPEQRQATILWANENMPDLARYAVQYGRGRGAVPILSLIRTRMVAMEEATADQMVRERMRRNIATENQIGQYLVEMQNGTAEQRAELQKKIEATMRENVEGFLTERQERIDRLKARLEMEQRALDQEKQSVDQIVARRLMPFRLALPETNSTAPPADPPLAAPPQGRGQ